MEAEKVVWGSFDSYDGERTLKEHAYKNRTINHWYENYTGATALCSKKYGVSEDGESYMSVEQIEGNDTPRMINTCKKCLKIWNNLNQQ